jgi:CHAD domain-containing protein
VARPSRGNPSPASSDRLRRELLRSDARLEQEVDRALVPSGLTPEDVHDLHRELRRLASGLVVWARLVPPRVRPAVAEAARRVRRLARLVGRLRDRDVTIALLSPDARRTHGVELLRPWVEFLGRLREDAHTGRELLRAFLRAERQGGLLDRTRALLDLPRKADADRGLVRILAQERRLRQGRVRRAHRKARRKLSSQRLHRLRIRIRQWRHLAALEVAAGAVVARPPPTWPRLQARLGKLHDLDVAIATVPEDLAGAAPALRLRQRRRKLRRSVRDELERIVARRARAAARAREPRLR